MPPSCAVRRASLLFFTGLTGLLLLAAGARAEVSEPVVYLGPHPPHPAVGGRYCEAAGEHAHDYVPVDPVLYVRTRGVWIFLGDPTAFGWEGPTWLWPGPHPVPASVGREGLHCARAGMHRHHFGPGAPHPVPAGESCTVPVAPWWWWELPARKPPRSRAPHDFDTTPSPPRAEPPPPAPPSGGSFGGRSPPPRSQRTERRR